MAVAFFALANFLAFIYGIFVSIHEIDIFVCVAFCLATVLSVCMFYAICSVFFSSVYFFCSFLVLIHQSQLFILSVRTAPAHLNRFMQCSFIIRFVKQATPSWSTSALNASNVFHHRSMRLFSIHFSIFIVNKVLSFY